MGRPAVLGVVGEAIGISFAVLGLEVEQLHFSVKSPLGFFEVLVFDSFPLELVGCQPVRQRQKQVCHKATASLLA
jgi:hypothetical protein